MVGGGCFLLVASSSSSSSSSSSLRHHLSCVVVGGRGAVPFLDSLPRLARVLHQRRRPGVPVPSSSFCGSSVFCVFFSSSLPRLSSFRWSGLGTPGLPSPSIPVPSFARFSFPSPVFSVSLLSVPVGAFRRFSPPPPPSGVWPLGPCAVTCARSVRFSLNGFPREVEPMADGEQGLDSPAFEVRDPPPPIPTCDSGGRRPLGPWFGTGGGGSRTSGRGDSETRRLSEPPLPVLRIGRRRRRFRQSC